ncbi:MAG: hypothetical protein ACK5UE_10035 [Chitinophagales bacterium]|jgi:hypothetical protein|nr:hypothetical protein [Sphingobacteriales bacterium]
MIKVFASLLLLLMVSLGYGQNRRSSSTEPAVKNETRKEVKKEEPKSTKDKKKAENPSVKEKSQSGESSSSSSANEYAGKSYLSPQSESCKMSTVIEFGAMPSDGDITTINIYGNLGLNFDIARMLHIGPYFRHKILTTHDYQVLRYNNIEYDVSSLKEWGTGVCVGAYFPLGRTLLLDPELRIGYNEFTIQHPQYTDVTNNFIYRNYVNFTPRLNLGLRITDYTIFNFHGGYTLPFLLNNPEAVPHYNPASFHYGIGVRFYLMK